MNKQVSNNLNSQKKDKIRWSHIFLIILITMLLTIAGTWWALRTYLFAPDFKLVILEQAESVQLNSKLKQLGYKPGPAERPSHERLPGQSVSPFDVEGNLRPEAYTEKNENRVISFTERELNALLANNTELAKKVAVDLSDNLMSARIRVPVDKDFPILGGKTLRLSGGLEVSYQGNRPVIVFKGLSIMGVPVPNAWLGGIKNIDLVKEFSVDAGFWKAFSEGVDNIKVADGHLRIKLKK